MGVGGGERKMEGEAGVAGVGGLGLGLSIVRGFVGAQQGEAVLGENPGGGAVFTVYLPRKLPQPSPQE